MKRFISLAICLCFAIATLVAQNEYPDPFDAPRTWPSWFIVDGDCARIVMGEGDTVHVAYGWQRREHLYIEGDQKYRLPFSFLPAQAMIGTRELPPPYAMPFLGEPWICTTMGYINLNNVSKQLAYAMMVHRPYADKLVKTKRLMRSLGYSTKPDKLPYGV